MDLPTFKNRFNYEVDETLNGIQDRLVCGAADNHEEYTGLVGRCTGLKESKEIFAEVMDKLFKTDDEDDDQDQA